jgi:single-strand DNA-binding protein
MGNITRDLEVRYTPGGAAVCDIGLAVNRKYKSGDEWKEEVLFIDVTTWGKVAENCGQFLSKGRPILVSGELVQDNWEDKATGQPRSKIKVRANVVQFLNAGGNSEGGGGGGGRNTRGGGGGGGFQTRGGGNTGMNQGGGGVGGSKPDDTLDLDSIPF